MNNKMDELTDTKRLIKHYLREVANWNSIATNLVEDWINNRLLSKPEKITREISIPITIVLENENDMIIDYIKFDYIKAELKEQYFVPPFEDPRE